MTDQLTLGVTDVVDIETGHVCKLHPHHGVTEWCECWKCGGEGVDGHDCGEDCCCCLEPEDNVRCDICEGNGGWWRCYTCAPVTADEDL